jgi:hypothetical protein
MRSTGLPSSSGEAVSTDCSINDATSVPRRAQAHAIAARLREIPRRSVLFDMEDLLDGPVEEARRLHGERERRVVPARLDGVDRLAGDAKRVGEGLLGEARRGPETPHLAAHG